MGIEPRRLLQIIVCCLLALPWGAPELRAYSAGSSKWTSPIALQLALGTPSTALTDGSPTWDAVAQNALAAWNPYMGSIQFSGVNASAAAKGQGNGINNVFFSPTVYGSAFGANTLAITISYTSGSTKVEGDVLFNSAFHWDSYRGPLRSSGGVSVQDLYRVALHEFGHVLGLNHPDQAGQNVQAIMNSIITNLDALTADDTAGALSIYTSGLTAPSITSHPSPQTINEGGSATFSVSATGSPPLTYQWLRNGSPISGATQASLFLSNVPLSAAGFYAVTVSNVAGTVTSNSALLTVNPTVLPPQILTQPVSQSVLEGSTVTFLTVVSGTPPFTYQWKRNNQVIASQAAPSLILTNVSSAQAGSYTVTVSNSVGSVTSNAATLTVIPGVSAPVISVPPYSRTVGLGDPVTFQVVATGNPAPSYQWRKNSVAIPGATGTFFTLASATWDDAGTYTVVVTNSVSSVISAPAILTISEPPVIVTGPASLSVPTGQRASMAVTVTGTAPFQFQWMKEGADLPGATTDTLVIEFARTSDSGNYRVRVSNSGGSVLSSPATLTVTPATFAPQIQTQPQSLTVPAGGAAAFSVSATGLPAPAYQWSKDNAPLPGATSATLLLSNVAPDNAGSYTVRVANSVGSIISAAAILTVTTPPVIVTPPASQTLTAGQAASLTVVATGTGPLGYQWRKDSTPVPTAAGSSLTFSAITLADAGTYTVTVQNSLGSVTSPPAVLTVLPPDSPPSIQNQPVSQTVISGNTVVFTVVASGVPAPKFQWYNGAAPIRDATGPTLTMTNVTIANAGSYRVTVSNALGTAVSDTVSLTVVTPPRILGSPASQSATVGSVISMDVSAAGTAPLAYQWFKDGIALPGSNGPSFVIARVEETDAGDYHVRVTNSAGAAVSAVAHVTVTPAPTPPKIVVHPKGQAVAPGSAVALEVVADGTGPLHYQWFHDDAIIPQATSSTLSLASVGPADAGTYTVVVTSSAGSATSNGATLTILAASRLINLSVRAQAGTGENALTVGFVTQGTAGKELLIRGSGPALEAFGVPNVLRDPQLQLFDEAGKSFVQNDNWQTSPGIAELFARMGAFAFPAGSKDAAITTSLGSGAYSAQLTSVDGGTGVALVELYDAGPANPNSKLINMSVRNFVGTDEKSLLVGLIIQGNLPKTLLFRGVGPTLRAFGLSQVLEDPYLTLMSGQTIITENDNWSGTASLKMTFARVGAFSLPDGSLDSALLATLPPGTYNIRLSGVRAATGVAILEVYDVP